MKHIHMHWRFLCEVMAPTLHRIFDIWKLSYRKIKICQVFAQMENFMWTLIDWKLPIVFLTVCFSLKFVQIPCSISVKLDNKKKTWKNCYFINIKNLQKLRKSEYCFKQLMLIVRVEMNNKITIALMVKTKPYPFDRLKTPHIHI